MKLVNQIGRMTRTKELSVDKELLLCLWQEMFGRTSRWRKRRQEEDSKPGCQVLKKLGFDSLGDVFGLTLGAKTFKWSVMSFR